MIYDFAHRRIVNAQGIRNRHQRIAMLLMGASNQSIALSLGKPGAIRKQGFECRPSGKPLPARDFFQIFTLCLAADVARKLGVAEKYLPDYLPPRPWAALTRTNKLSVTTLGIVRNLYFKT